MTQESTAQIRREYRTVDEQTVDETQESLIKTRGWKPPKPGRHPPLRRLRGRLGSYRGNCKRMNPTHEAARSLCKRQGTSIAVDLAGSRRQCGPIIHTTWLNNPELKGRKSWNQTAPGHPQIPSNPRRKPTVLPGFGVVHPAQVRGHKDRYCRRSCGKNIRHPNWYSSLNLTKYTTMH